MKSLKPLIFTLCLLLGTSLLVQAEMRPILKHRVGVPPFEVLKTMLETNLSPSAPPRIPSGDMANRAPYITMLADGDARVEPRLILPEGSALIYAVRNLANQLATSPGSVDYGVNILHTPVLLILGNTDSEAAQLVVSDHAALPAAIQAELDHLFGPALSVVKHRGKKKELTLAQKARLIVEENVDSQVDKAVSRYHQRIQAGRLVVMGGILDIANQYGKGKNCLLIININGEKNDRALQRLAIANHLRPELKKMLGRMPAPSKKKK